MSQILIGTSSWADNSLAQSGLFYPPEIETPAGRLRYYSERFPIAEIDSSYHYFPTQQNLTLWLENTLPGFVFDIRAFSLFTGHPTPPHSLPRSIREEHEELANHKSNLYLHHLPGDVADRLWEIFSSYARTIETAGKLGIKDGDWVYIENKRGKIKQKAALTTGIDPRVVIADYDWWFPEKGASELYGWAESNVNMLTNDKPPFNREIGSANLRGFLCRVYKV